MQLWLGLAEPMVISSRTYAVAGSPMYKTQSLYFENGELIIFSYLP